MERLDSSKIYRYKANGMKICGSCANDRTYPENVEGYGGLLIGVSFPCQYCGVEKECAQRKE